MYRLIQFVAFLMFMFIAERASACSCLYQDPSSPEVVAQALDSADVVFVGTAVSAETTEPPEGEYGRMIQTTVFQVKKSWKGEATGQITTKVNIQCCLCGFSFEEDQVYLVFGHQREDGSYSVSVCGLSRTLAQAGEIPRILNEITQ